MVSNAERKEQDPNYRRGPTQHRVQTDRGAGYYYHRGNGWYSKLDETLDGKRFHKRKKVRDRKKALSKSPHKGDYKTKGSKTRSPKTTGGPRAGNRRGWY